MILKEKILKLRATPYHPLSLKEIALKLGCSKTYVARVIKQAKSNKKVAKGKSTPLQAKVIKE